MRLLRALLALLLVLVVGALLAAWLVPPRLDLDRYRSAIASVASKRLGRPVSIGGRIALRLLPEPMLTASDIGIGSGDTANITASELRLRLALGPLVQGRIDARELVLRGADLHLPWPLDPAEIMVRTPVWLSALSARVEDGRLSIGGFTLTGIDATLTTTGYGGSYVAAGTAQLSGRPWRFTARLTQPGRDGSAGLDVTLDGQGPAQGIGATLSGQIGPDGTLGGRVTGRGPDLSQLLPAPAVAFKAEGRMTIADGLAAADDLAMEIGGSPARGAVALRVSPAPRLDLALAASRLDLDGWLPVLSRTGPLALPVGIDLSAEAASFAGGTLRGLRGAVDLSSAGAEVREARAVLPGDAPLRLSGRVTPLGGSPPRARFEGDVDVTAPALRTTLAWLEGAGVAPFAALPDGVLRTADLSGHVVAEPGQVAVGALDGTVDGSRVAGSLTLRGGKRFVIGAGLTVDRLDLDPWLPSGLPALSTIPAWFAKFDVDLRLEARQALIHGITIAPLSLDAGAEGGQLTLRKLDLQVNGVHANGSVTVGEGGRVSEGRLDLQAPQAEPLAMLLPDHLGFLGHRAPRLWRAAANVQVLGSGEPNNLGLKVTVDLADLRLEAQPIFDLAKQSWTATMQLRHPGAPRLAEALGIASAPSWLGDGSLSLVAQLSGTADKFAADSFELAAGSLRATGALLLDRRGARPALSGHVAAETLPLPLPYPRALDPLPIAWLADWDGSVNLTAGHVLAGLSPVLEQVGATLSLHAGALRADGLTAQLGGGKLAGLAGMDTQASPPTVAVNVTLAGAAIGGPVFDLPLDLVAGTLDAEVALTAAGHSPSALLSTLGGRVHLAAHDGTLSGVALAKATGDLPEAAVRAALADGTTPFTRLDLVARAASGVLTLEQGTVSALSGSGVLSGSLDLAGASADLRLVLRPAVPDPPELGLLLAGPLDALRRTPELADLIRWHAAHPAPVN